MSLAVNRPADGIDPGALLAIRDLELRARIMVEGLWAGLHRSPFSGFSVEFTEYRQYSPGDDLRYLDWKVLARTDRHSIKKFEDETNVRCQILLDSSRSMLFGSTGYSKADYARTLAATLACFLLKQRDMVGLALFDQSIQSFLPARWRHGHLRRLLGLLEQAPSGRETRLAPALDQAALLWRKRSLVILISDLLVPVGEWDGALGRLAAGGHDVRVLQVLDPAEQTLNFGRTALWEDLESGQRLYVDPEQARPSYQERFAAHQAEVKGTLERRGLRHQVVSTDQPIDRALLAMLGGGRANRPPARRGRNRL